MTAARRTLGSGRARTTKPASSDRGHHRSPSPADARRPGTAPCPAASTTATLLPDTADRCVMPVASIASVSEAGVRLVSPITSAGQQPPGVGWQRGDRAAQAGPDAARPPPRPARRRAGARAAPRVEDGHHVVTAARRRRAARWCARSRASARPSTRRRRRRAPGCAPGSAARARPPAARRAAPAPARCVVGPVVGTTRGSVVTTASTVTVARSRARLGTSPASRSSVCAPSETRHSGRAERGDGQQPGPAQPAPPAADQQQRQGRQRRRQRASTATGGRDRPSAAPVQATSAGSSSRASMPRATRARPRRRVRAAAAARRQSVAVGAAASPGGSGGRHTRTFGPDLGEQLVADPADLAELVDRGEPAVLGPPVQDPLRQHRAHARQRVEGRPASAQFRSTGTALGPRRPCPATCRRRTARCAGADAAPGAHGPPPGRRLTLRGTWICSPSTTSRARLSCGRSAPGAAPPAAVDRVEHPRARRQPHHPGPADRAHDVHDDHRPSPGVPAHRRPRAVVRAARAVRPPAGARRPAAGAGEGRRHRPGSSPVGGPGAPRAGARHRLRPWRRPSPAPPAPASTPPPAARTSSRPEHRHPARSHRRPAQRHRHGQQPRPRRGRPPVPTVVRPSRRPTSASRPRAGRPRWRGGAVSSTSVAARHPPRRPGPPGGRARSGRRPAARRDGPVAAGRCGGATYGHARDAAPHPRPRRRAVDGGTNGLSPCGGPRSAASAGAATQRMFRWCRAMISSATASPQSRPSTTGSGSGPNAAHSGQRHGRRQRRAGDPAGAPHDQPEQRHQPQREHGEHRQDRPERGRDALAAAAAQVRRRGRARARTASPTA